MVAPNWPLISIVTINHNNATGLNRTLSSIQRQTYKNYELIIIDGGSTDHFSDIINRYESLNATTISEKDRGISHAFNKGTNLCRGDLVNYLNSGDCYIHEQVLDRVATYWRNNEGAAWGYGFRKRVDNNNNIYNVRRNEMAPYSFKSFLEGRLLISHQATFFSISSLKEAGLYSETYQFSCMDYDLMLKIAKKHKPLIMPEAMVLYDEMGISSKGLFKSLRIKHKIRCEVGDLNTLERLCDIIRTLRIFLEFRSKNILKKVLKKSKLGRKLLNASSTKL